MQHGGPQSEANPSGDARRVADRYRVEGPIGRGGMAVVYCAFDEQRGEHVALKQLVVRDHRGPTLRAMFENEYHTLLELVHPAIVRAYDFGTDGDDVFYTMELLDGRDLRKLPEPLGVAEACVLLRDVASALALIHSRRLLHRDVSPHNVWRTPAGRAKLIDFGTLVAMGPQQRVVGTPPYVPPEAMHGQPLDARADLYALGALAHCLLSGRDAYPAKAMHQLPALWKRPAPRLDALRDDLPPALCALVTALLSLDPRGRPGSAAEVVERLAALTSLPPEDVRPVAQAYLTTPTLVGRREVTQQLRRLLVRADRGRGAAIALTGAPGMGRSRMLASLVVEAKLLGANTVSVDLDAVTPGRRQVATALSAALQEATAPPPRIVDSDVVPRAPQAGDSEPPGLGMTMRLGADLVSSVELASAGRLLVVAVDDVHRADDSSLAVLARLAAAAPGCGFVLATTCEQEALAEEGSMLSRLVDASIALPLAPLDGADTRALLASVFGEAEGLDDAAAWLHELSQGSPDACMSYAQYLVDQGLARYASGRWSLARRLRDHALPDDFDAMLTLRLQALSADARELALGLALTFDDTRPVSQPETHVRIQDFPKLLGDDSARAFTALGELLRARVVEQRGDRFVLAQRALVSLSIREAGAEACAAMHGRLGRLFEQESYEDRIMIYRHLQRAGEYRRAMHMMVAHSEQLGRERYRWDQMRIAMTLQTHAEALRFWQAHGETPRQGVLLRRHLLAAATVYEWDVGEHGDAQVERLRYDCGLDVWDEGDAAATPLERLTRCLQHAQARHDAAPASEQGLTPLEAVRQLAADTVMLTGTYANSLDFERLDALSHCSEALRPLTPVTGLLADMSVLTRERVRGVELGERLRELIDRFLGDEQMPEVLRESVSFVLSHIQGVEDALRGRKRAFGVADRLELGAPFERWAVVHLRWLAHGFRGNDARSDTLRVKVEGATEDDVWRRKAFLFAELQLYALRGELLSLSSTVNAIDALAVRFDGWRPWAELGHAQLHRLRDELDEADARLTSGLALAPAGAHRAWVALAPAQAELRLERGDLAGALEAARSMRAAVRDHGLDLVADVAALRIEALACSGQGEAARAAAVLDEALELADAIGLDGLPRVPLHEAEAEVALAEGDPGRYARALGALQRLLQAAEAPALHRKHDALRARGALLLDEPAPAQATAATRASSVSPYRELTTRLESLTSSRERGEHVLHLLLEESGASSGHLFLYDAGGVLLAASVAEGYPSAALVSAVQAELETGDRGARTTAGGGVTPTDAWPALELGADGRFVAIPLHGSDAARTLGIAALASARGEALHAIRPGLLAAIGRGLEQVATAS